MCAAAREIYFMSDNYVITYNEIYDSYYGYTENEYIALYDIEGNKLYDFKEKNAELYYSNGSDYDMFITRYTVDGIDTYDLVFEGRVEKTFTVTDNEYLDVSRNYYVRYMKSGVTLNGEDVYEYGLYNVKGELMLKSEHYILVVSCDDNGAAAIVRKTVGDTMECEFYRFSMEG